MKDGSSWSLLYTPKEVRLDVSKGVCSHLSDASPSFPLSVSVRLLDDASLISSQACCEVRANVNLSEPTECLNFKVKDLKINMLETRIKILEAILELERHPEDHTCQSGAIFYKLFDDMENICNE
ncbi:hypothetical protein Tco_0366605 [Tanacetum coccineum]